MNRLARPILFAMEPDVVLLFLRASFGAAGAPTLDTNNSKGFCNLTRNSIAYTGDTTNGSATVANVSSFVGLYKGMSVTGTGIAAATTISSMTPGSGTITLSANATATNVGTALTSAGGQYTVQLGAQAGVRFDTYVKLLSLTHAWDMSGLQGGATTGASSPAAPAMFLISNKVSTKTVPPTVATNLTDATFQVQFGTLSGATFTAADPATGEILRLGVRLCRSNAI